MANTTTRRGHRAKGSHTNPDTPAVRQLVADLAGFFESLRVAVLPKTRSPRHLCLRACARDCGINYTSLRTYISGDYIPAPETAAALAAWLKQAQTTARREGLL